LRGLKSVAGILTCGADEEVVDLAAVAVIYAVACVDSVSLGEA
jgi:hypothetical protein